MSLNRWRWLNDVVLPLAMAILRLCWLWPWLTLFRRWLAPSYGRAFLAPELIVGLSLGGMALARWTLARRRSLAEARAWAAGVGLGVILLLLWWQFLQGQYPLWDLRWFARLGQMLAYWREEVPPAFIALLVAAGATER